MEETAANSEKHCDPRGSDATQAYPTDSKERRKIREKAAKEAGTPLEVVKQKKHIENHFDDCGEDLSSLNSAKNVVLPPGAAHRSTIVSPGWGSTRWQTN